MGQGRPLSDADLLAYVFLTTFVNDEHEPYFPADGPYYTSFDYFAPRGLERVREDWARTTALIRSGKAPPDLGLYVHWPFCATQCSFCFCSVAVPGDAAEMRVYARTLMREMDALKDLFKGLRFNSVYFGGGTPTLIADADLEALFSHMRASFDIEPGAEVYLEASPATLTGAKAGLLKRYGFNRVTLGVQSLEEGVLAAVNRRGQTREKVEQALRLLGGEDGIFSGVELMCGLEGQTEASFLRDLRDVLRMNPDAVYLYAFDPRAQTLFTRAGSRLTLDQRRRQAAVLKVGGAAERLAGRFGYKVPAPETGEGRAACPVCDALSAQCKYGREWGSSILGIGAAALSHAWGSSWYLHTAYEGGRTSDFLPAVGLESDVQEERHGYAVRHLWTEGRLPREGFRELFGLDPLEAPGLGPALKELAAKGVLSVEPAEVSFLRRERLAQLVWVKHLYSRRVKELLLKTHAGAWAVFRRRHAGKSEEELYGLLEGKMAALAKTLLSPAARRTALRRPADGLAAARS